MKGLDNRSRDEDGEIREKRGDTLVKHLRQFSALDRFSGNMRLDTLRDKYDVDSLDALLRKLRR